METQVKYNNFFLTISDVFKKTKETFGRIDIVVNNAGIGGESDEEWEAVVDVNMVIRTENLSSLKGI